MCPGDSTADMFKIDNYTAYRKDRTINEGGGVILFVCDNFNSELIANDLWLNLELVACKISFGQKSLIVVCVYRPPSSSREYNQGICSALCHLCELHSDQIIVCGDFNFPKIDWYNHIIYTSELSDEKQFYDAIQSSFLHQHVEKFTRQRGSDFSLFARSCVY